MTDNQSPEYNGQNFDGPVLVDGKVLMNPTILVSHREWVLSKYDFYQIINSQSQWLLMAQTLLGATIALFINMAAKLVGNKMDKTIVFDKWEVYAFFIAAGIMVTCFMIHKFVPNNGRKIVRQIKKHFEQA